MAYLNFVCFREGREGWWRRNEIIKNKNSGPSIRMKKFWRAPLFPQWKAYSKTTPPPFYYFEQYYG